MHGDGGVARGILVGSQRTCVDVDDCVCSHHWESDVPPILVFFPSCWLPSSIPCAPQGPSSGAQQGRAEARREVPARAGPAPFPTRNLCAPLRRLTASCGAICWRACASATFRIRKSSCRSMSLPTRSLLNFAFFSQILRVF